MDFSSLNILAIIVAGIAAWALGSLWYSPLLFSKSWQKELGFTDEYLKQGNMGLIFGSSAVLMIIMAFGMALLITGHGDLDKIDWISGLTHGIWIGLFFVATSIGINVLYQRKSMKLWLIDAGYQVLFLALMGAIIGAWH